MLELPGQLARYSLWPVSRFASHRVTAVDRATFPLDDTPTERYGPHVWGAGIHPNPCPGPSGSPIVYGHVWVVLGLLAAHAAWGVVALPLLAPIRQLPPTPSNEKRR